MKRRQDNTFQTVVLHDSLSLDIHVGEQQIPKTQIPEVTTVLEDDGENQEDYYSPIDAIPLRDRPVIETGDEGEDIAEHCRPRPEFGNRDNPNQEPYPIFPGDLKTDNPTEPGLPPDKLVGRTFLLPPGKDGSRKRAKIVELLQEHLNGMTVGVLHSSYHGTY